ncbi:glycosyltransferase family protein [Bacillus tuaregi]|uniref:hypothetical protein n=1 Tax=Bacillus tuaregi TaxID=1816695 RepID=UPI0008F8C278|nr:hypothetical protein [Bacillus tuaregi]
MKRILIVMGNHSPVPSSVANCVEPLVKKMIDSGFEVDVVTNRKQVSFPKYERIHNVNIYRVDDYRTMNAVILNEAQQVNSTKVLKLLTRIFSLCLKGLYYAKYCAFAKEKETGGWQIQEVVGKCLELHNQKKYNAVLSISQPFKSHYIAEEFINKIKDPIKWFIYEFDPFSFNKEVTKSQKKRNRLLKDEFRMFNKCDKVFLTPELFNFYKKTPLNKFMEKFQSVPFANMERIEYKEEEAAEINFSSDKINCLFTGRLYKDIRNPKYALDFFSVLNNIHFTLLTNFSKETLRQYVDDIEKFTILPMQSRDTALNSLMKADILVNIGNSVEFQVPGKIFEYMSSGKPIIHFSKFPEDPALYYLRKYPLVFIVNEWERNTIDYSTEFESFCQKYKNSKLSFEEVKTLLYEFDGENVAKEFVNKLGSLMEDRI